LKKRIYMTYPKELIKEPLIYNIGKDFQVATNIRQATISDTIGLVAVSYLERGQGRADRTGRYRVITTPYPQGRGASKFLTKLVMYYKLDNTTRVLRLLVSLCLLLKVPDR